MTENEAISAIQNDLEWHSKELKPKYKKVLEYAIQALEKVQQFEAIGTIEELKALKNKHIGKDNMVISSSDLMTILNSDSEELKQYKEVGTVEEFKALKEKEDRFDRNIRMFNSIGLEIRAKAIDEFSERLKDSLLNNYRHLITTDSDGFDWLTTDAVHTHIDKITEQLKGGAV